MRVARHPVRAVAVAGAAVCTIGSGAFVQPATASVPVCGGEPRCHEVARVDVNGDGTPDRVALVRRGGNRAEHGSVTVRVKTSPTHVESARRRTFFWSGGLWQGAGALDGRPGRELVVGHAMGAH